MTARSKLAVRDGIEPETAFSGQNARNGVRVHVSCRAILRRRAFRPSMRPRKALSGVMVMTFLRSRRMRATAPQTAKEPPLAAVVGEVRS